MSKENKESTRRFSKKDYENMSKLSGRWEKGKKLNIPNPRNNSAKLIEGYSTEITDEEIEKDLAWVYEKMDEDGIL